MKKTLLWNIVGLAIAAFFFAASAGVYVAGTTFRPGPLTSEKFVMVDRGMGVSAIAARMESEGVIHSAFVFKCAAATGADGKSLKAGEYRFSPHTSIAQVLTMLRAGDVYERKITIPEGYTVWQAVELVKALSDLQGDVKELPAEGHILPQTYFYTVQDTKDSLLVQMTKAMDQTLAQAWDARAQGLPLNTPQEALTLASIVEKETGVPSERARIAGVFINRLKRGMPLQTDPTVIYALTKGKIEQAGQGPLGRRLLSKDLSVNSPYNTYLNAGLPPTPIANPGKDAVKATLNPEQHDYIYFVADGTGGHVFSKTLAEHNANVAKWRKIRRSQSQ